MRNAEQAQEHRHERYTVTGRLKSDAQLDQILDRTDLGPVARAAERLWPNVRLRPTFLDVLFRKVERADRSNEADALAQLAELLTDQLLHLVRERVQAAMQLGLLAPSELLDPLDVEVVFLHRQVVQNHLGIELAHARGLPLDHPPVVVTGVRRNVNRCRNPAALDDQLFRVNPVPGACERPESRLAALVAGISRSELEGPASIPQAKPCDGGMHFLRLVSEPALRQHSLVHQINCDFGVAELLANGSGLREVPAVVTKVAHDISSTMRLIA